MKIIGLPNKSIQYVLFNLKPLNVGFLEDLQCRDVIICQDLRHYKKNILNFHKARCTCKVLIILDYIKVLENIRGIQILQGEIPIEKFKAYILRCTDGIPTIKLNKDQTIQQKIDSVENNSFFSKIIYPTITCGIKSTQHKQQIISSIVKSIIGLVKKGSPEIEKYQQDIKPKYYKAFINWLTTAEARKVCQCLITRTVKYGFDSFEINYLLKSLTEE